VLRLNHGRHPSPSPRRGSCGFRPAASSLLGLKAGRSPALSLETADGLRLKTPAGGRGDRLCTRPIGAAGYHGPTVFPEADGSSPCFAQAPPEQPMILPLALDTKTSWLGCHPPNDDARAGRAGQAQSDRWQVSACFVPINGDALSWNGAAWCYRCSPEVWSYRAFERSDGHPAGCISA